ncbi:hypothetical protein CRUP_029656, partial [Coryphaenoides rupestris]
FYVSVAVMAALSVASVALPPPARLPDLFPVLVSTFSFLHFLGTFVYFNVVQLGAPHGGQKASGRGHLLLLLRAAVAEEEEEEDGGSRYWTPATSSLNFDDFCEILKLEKETDEDEVLRIFRGMDVNGDGFISHREMEAALTTRGEKMTAEEIRAVFSIADVNKDGKLDYAEFCRMLGSTVERCRSKALERLEADAKIKRQNFGSQMDGHMTAAAAPLLPPEPHRPGSDPPLKKEGRTLSRGSSARSRRSSLSSNAVTMATSGSKASGKTLEPAALQDWQHGAVRGCFFVEEEGTITSLQYGLHLPQRSSVYLSIHPLSLDHRTPDPVPCLQLGWSVDTDLFLDGSAGTPRTTGGLLGFTESRDETYFLLPFNQALQAEEERSHTDHAANHQTTTTALVYRNRNREAGPQPGKLR